MFSPSFGAFRATARLQLYPKCNYPQLSVVTFRLNLPTACSRKSAD
jgi:hypothetical protein